MSAVLDLLARPGDASTDPDEVFVGRDEPLARYPLLATSDVGEAEAGGAQLLSEYRLRVRREPRFNARVNGSSLGGVDLYYLDFGRTDVDVASAALAGRYGIVIPVDGAMLLRHRGREVHVVAGSSAAVVSPGAEFRMTFTDRFRCLVVRAPQPLFESFVRSVAPGSASEHPIFEPLVDRPAAVRGLYGALEVMHDCVTRADVANGVPGPLAAHVRDQLVTTLVTMQPHDLVSHLFRPVERTGRRCVREAIELIDADVGAVRTVHEVARAVGVTTRALQAGFRHELGVSPASYMHQVRLTRVRDALLAAGPEDHAGVGDIASRWGFPHGGRFAAYYRDQFGESPSETLRRPPG